MRNIAIVFGIFELVACGKLEETGKLNLQIDRRVSGLSANTLSTPNYCYAVHISAPVFDARIDQFAGDRVCNSGHGPTSLGRLSGLYSLSALQSGVDIAALPVGVQVKVDLIGFDLGENPYLNGNCDATLSSKVTHFTVPTDYNKVDLILTPPGAIAGNLIPENLRKVRLIASSSLITVAPGTQDATLTIPVADPVHPEYDCYNGFGVRETTATADILGPLPLTNATKLVKVQCQDATHLIKISSVPNPSPSPTPAPTPTSCTTAIALDNASSLITDTSHHKEQWRIDECNNTDCTTVYRSRDLIVDINP